MGFSFVICSFLQLQMGKLSIILWPRGVCGVISFSLFFLQSQLLILKNKRKGEIQDNKHYPITSSMSLAARTESPLANASMPYKQISHLRNDPNDTGIKFLKSKQGTRTTYRCIIFLHCAPVLPDSFTKKLVVTFRSLICNWKCTVGSKIMAKMTNKNI